VNMSGSKMKRDVLAVVNGLPGNMGKEVSMEVDFATQRHADFD